MTYREAIDFGKEILSRAGIAEAKTDAWLLLEMACKIDRNFYYMHMEEELQEEYIREYEIALKKRAERVPLQYIVGETEFMGLKFKVNSNVLIPRQDTETLVEETLKVLRPGMRVLDLCTGSGCVIISILHNAWDVEGYATDISKQALIVAKENARLNDVTVNFEWSDLFDYVTGTYDIIVSNPPYIPTGEIAELMPEVSRFEPIESLDGKEDGLEFYRKIIAQCKQYLNPNGKVFLEIGYNQAKAVSSLFLKEGFEEIRVIKDLAGKDRVVTGMRKDSDYV
ncbi:MAG: peptide chain release factor N(5)-glutamine methyltransferase [Clostridiales bacterium]|nr:peptide chain release factor N(5)-glutamine methyltransferase [Clostridiales bacterium]